MARPPKGIDAKRGDISMIPPEQLTIVTDKAHPLYDPRAESKVSPEMIQNILFHGGVIEPVVCRRNGDAVEVVVGRQRVRAAIAANERLKEQGSKVTIRVPVIMRNGDDKEMLAVMVSENEVRRANTITEKAKVAERLQKAGYTKDEIATIFGVSRQALSNWLEAASLAPAVREAIEKGEIKATAALALKNLPREEQAEKIKELVAPGKKPTEKALREGLEPPKPKMRTRKEIMEMIAAAPDTRESKDYHRGFEDALGWVLGGK